ncbi:MAG: amidohydrolase family protein, partial [Acidimicrobiales bacterium]
EDTVGLVKLIGADNVVFGSDYPHPEGMFDPLTFVDEIDELPESDQAKVMGGNLGQLMKVPAAA